MTRTLSSRTRPAPAPARPRRPGLDVGLLVALASAAAFGTSGPFSKALLGAGWTAGSVVLLRVTGAALILLVPALLAMRGRWHRMLDNLPRIVVFGLAAVAGCQVAYVNAVQHLSVGVALLLEYLAVVLVALWVWLRTGIAPNRLTWLGMVASVAGLVLVLDLAGQSPPAVVGVAWGLLAAVGLAVYFLVAAADADGLPPVALAAFGMVVAAVALAGLGLTGLLPMTFSAAPVLVGGLAIPSWLAVTELAAIAAALAYLLGTVAARRLGAGVASFVGLTEVLFAVLFAWLLLGELPAPVQLAGGALIIGGVLAVRRGGEGAL
ncbi:MAG TPA: DMT family transporter [Pseudonocardia sp.]|nr:DMT family transporter [Pseudonocardia sp.]